MHDGAIPCAIQYIELSSSGSSVEFGNTVTTKVGCASCSSTTIGLFSGGSDGSLLSSIEYVHINTLGNSSEYGDLTVARMELTGCSDCHGGLA